MLHCHQLFLLALFSFNVLSESVAHYLSGLRASTGTAEMNECKGLSGNRTEQSEGELSNFVNGQGEAGTPLGQPLPKFWRELTCATANPVDNE